MTHDSLKPCPFCGSPDVEMDEIDRGVYCACCNTCGVIGPAVQDAPSAAAARNIAADKWNQRIFIH